MKKVKIMLLSLALFAVVGGALAFKAKFDKTWCFAPTYGNGFTCTTLDGAAVTTTQCEGIAITFKNDATGIFSCTTLPDGEACPVLCPVYAKVKPNN
jgi:hypothetical protein